MKKKMIGFVFLSLLPVSLVARGQDTETTRRAPSQEEVTIHDGQQEKASKAWEIGVGGSLINWNRVAITGFRSTPENYFYNLKANHLMGGANLYVARELNRWFYLDLQGTVGVTSNNRTTGSGRKHDWLYMGGLGLQFRFTPLFKSKWVEPYLRVGVNYLHKDFTSVYGGNFVDDPTGEARWESFDTWNHDGRSSDKNSFIPLSFGAGVKAWLSNSFGLGLQGEYLLPVQKSLPHFVQISASVIWRIGGKNKHTPPVVRYVEVEKPVEVERIVERVVERKEKVPVMVDTVFCDLLENIHFEFDKDVITLVSHKILDRLAALLKNYPDSHFLITGYTDARGSAQYNLRLSERRAKAVYKALLERGVPSHMLKWRGFGNRAALVPPVAADNIREGDRKILLEKVTNMEYWKVLGKED